MLVSRGLTWSDTKQPITTDPLGVIGLVGESHKNLHQLEVFTWNDPRASLHKKLKRYNKEKGAYYTVNSTNRTFILVHQ